MAETPRIDIPEPPRFFGDPTKDSAALVQWVWDFYNAAVTAGGFVQPADLGPSLQEQFPVLHALGVLEDISADEIPYFTGPESWGLVGLSSFTRTLFPKTTSAEYRTALGIGTAGTLSGDSGVYTPVHTLVTNLDASTAFQCQVLQLGTIVFVAGVAHVDPTLAGACELGISLPIPSNFGAAEDCAGAAAAIAVAGFSAGILADTVNDRASMRWIAVDTANRELTFTFAYQVL